MPQWPWPDNRLARRERIAHMYRDALFDSDPKLCNDIDKLMHICGQQWILDTPAPDPDETWTVQQLAEHFEVHINAVYHWIKRHNIQPVTSGNYRRRYRLGDMPPYKNAKRNNTDVIYAQVDLCQEQATR